MAEEPTEPQVSEDADEQLELNFPDTDAFPSYDGVDSEQGEAEMRSDSFDETAAKFDDEDGTGCCVR